MGIVLYSPPHVAQNTLSNNSDWKIRTGRISFASARKRFSVNVPSVHFHFRLRGVLVFAAVPPILQGDGRCVEGLISSPLMTNACSAITYVVRSFHDSFRYVGES